MNVCPVRPALVVGRHRVGLQFANAGVEFSGIRHCAAMI